VFQTVATDSGPGVRFAVVADLGQRRKDDALVLLLQTLATIPFAIPAFFAIPTIPPYYEKTIATADIRVRYRSDGELRERRFNEEREVDRGWTHLHNQYDVDSAVTWAVQRDLVRAAVVEFAWHLTRIASSADEPPHAEPQEAPSSQVQKSTLPETGAEATLGADKTKAVEPAPEPTDVRIREAGPLDPFFGEEELSSPGRRP
jgi:hypothetical protein